MSISVLILTYNEAVNITDCLRSVSWSDDVVVLDSFSSDETPDLSRRCGARVIQRSFDNYAAQRNFGLQSIQYRHPWILMLDADERVTTDLQLEMLTAVRGCASDVTMFRFRRRDHLYGRWIRRSGGYPTWFGRLARAGCVWVDRPVNEEYRTDGRILPLQGHIEHHPFNKGFHEWISKHDRYSSSEAALLAGNHAGNWRLLDLLSREPTRRRASAKGLIYSLPFRPAIVFLGLYLFRGGLIEGRAGLTFCVLRAWYEFLIDCKRRELTRRAQGLPI